MVVLSHWQKLLPYYNNRDVLNMSRRSYNKQTSSTSKNLRNNGSTSSKHFRGQRSPWKHFRMFFVKAVQRTKIAIEELQEVHRESISEDKDHHGRTSGGQKTSNGRSYLHHHINSYSLV